MDSDSDATIIEESGDEAMEVEEVPLLNSQPQIRIILNTSPHIAEHPINIIRNTISNTSEDNSSSASVTASDDESQEEHQQDEDANSESPSLLSAHITGEQELSVKSLVKHEIRNESDGKSPKKRPHCDEDDNEDDGKTCPICLDNWTNLGEHRICALKCGHLFGLNCIVRWFSTQKKKSCPTCKKKAMKDDIRFIYAKKLIAVDVTELELVKKQLKDVTEEKNKTQIELTKVVCREHLIMQQVEDLKKKVQYLDSALETRKHLSNSQTSSNSSNNETVRLYMDKSLEICKEAGCRVLDYFNSQDIIAVSMKSPNPLFSGFGVRIMNISTYKPVAFIPLHMKTIRDVRFNPENPWILSVSLDKTIKVFDTTSNMPVAINTSGDIPLWSCCWDANNSNMLYVGKQQGSVAKFDIRLMSEPVCTLEVPGDMSPVVSVSPIAICPGSAVANGGIISCKLNSLWVFENTSGEYTRYPLPLEGPFISMTYHNDKQQLLVSTRSNSRCAFSKHYLCNIENGTSNNLLCNTIHCFTGSTTQKFLSRSCLVSNKSEYYVAAHQESSKSVLLWNVRTGNKTTSLPARDPVLDLCGININNTNFIASLTERKLEFFKFV